MSPLIFIAVAVIFFGCLFGFSAGSTMALFLVVCFAALANFLTIVLIRLLDKNAIFDTPNARSMHIRPVPRGGGWSFVILMALGFALLLFSNAGVVFMRHEVALLLRHWEVKSALFTGAWQVRDGVDFFQYYGIDAIILSMLAGFVALAGVSWRDDRRGVPARIRLAVQLAAVALALCFYPAELVFPYWVPSWIAYPVIALAWVWFINLYNFMDGIDGITAIETITISFAVGFIGLKIFADTRANDLTLIIALVLFGGGLGFLRHNWHPARIFLGDVGSITIGYLLGFCLLHLAAMGYWHIALTLPLYYLADSGITLATRLWYGQKIWEAHRSHFYQIAAQTAGRHDMVVAKIAACNFILVLLALLALLHGPWICLAAPVPVAILLRHFAKTGQIAYRGMGNG